MRQSYDPITTYHQQLVAWNVATKEELHGMEKCIRANVEKEVEEAERMSHPEPDPAILFEDSYAPGSEPRWLRGRTIDETYYYR